MCANGNDYIHNNFVNIIHRFAMMASLRTPRASQREGLSTEIVYTVPPPTDLV